ncbi:MAG TPA: hypothetical protein VLK22_01255 [Candidatus Udaeobacter sp.]|nr:hypothetical protein [Candidatus Udaeobacter sp.]
MAKTEREDREDPREKEFNKETKVKVEEGFFAEQQKAALGIKAEIERLHPEDPKRAKLLKEIGTVLGNIKDLNGKGSNNDKKRKKIDADILKVKAEMEKPPEPEVLQLEAANIDYLHAKKRVEDIFAFMQKHNLAKKTQGNRANYQKDLEKLKRLLNLKNVAKFAEPYQTFIVKLGQLEDLVGMEKRGEKPQAELDKFYDKLDPENVEFTENRGLLLKAGEDEVAELKAAAEKAEQQKIHDQRLKRIDDEYSTLIQPIIKAMAELAYPEHKGKYTQTDIVPIMAKRDELEKLKLEIEAKVDTVTDIELTEEISKLNFLGKGIIDLLTEIKEREPKPEKKTEITKEIQGQRLKKVAATDPAIKEISDLVGVVFKPKCTREEQIQINTYIENELNVKTAAIANELKTDSDADFEKKLADLNSVIEKILNYLKKINKRVSFDVYNKRMERVLDQTFNTEIRDLAHACLTSEPPKQITTKEWDDVRAKRDRAQEIRTEISDNARIYDDATFEEKMQSWNDLNAEIKATLTEFTKREPVVDEPREDEEVSAAEIDSRFEEILKRNDFIKELMALEDALRENEQWPKKVKIKEWRVFTDSIGRANQIAIEIEQRLSTYSDPDNRATAQDLSDLDEAIQGLNILDQANKAKLEEFVARPMPKGLFTRIAEGGKKLKDAIFNREVGKIALETGYNTVTSVLGVKIISDVVRLGAGKVGLGQGGDLAEWQRGKKAKEIIAEAYSALTEALKGNDDGEIEKRSSELKEKIESSRITPEAKAALLDKLLEISQKHREAADEVKKEREEEIQKVLDNYVQSKVSGIKIARDVANLALTATGMSVLRGVMYAGVAVAERISKAKRKHAQETKNDVAGEPEKELSYKDILVAAATETAHGITLGVFSKEQLGAKRRTIEFIKAAGTVARAFGITGMALHGFEAPGNSIDRLLHELKERGAGAIIYNLDPIENAKHIVQGWQHAGHLITHPSEILTGHKDSADNLQPENSASEHLTKPEVRAAAGGAAVVGGRTAVESLPSGNTVNTQPIGSHLSGRENPNITTPTDRSVATVAPEQSRSAVTSAPEQSPVAAPRSGEVPNQASGSETARPAAEATAPARADQSPVNITPDHAAAEKAPEVVNKTETVGDSTPEVKTNFSLEHFAVENKLSQEYADAVQKLVHDYPALNNEESIKNILKASEVGAGVHSHHKFIGKIETLDASGGERRQVIFEELLKQEGGEALAIQYLKDQHFSFQHLTHLPEKYIHNGKLDYDNFVKDYNSSVENQKGLFYAEQGAETTNLAYNRLEADAKGDKAAVDNHVHGKVMYFGAEDKKPILSGIAGEKKSGYVSVDQMSSKEQTEATDKDWEPIPNNNKAPKAAIYTDKDYEADKQRFDTLKAEHKAALERDIERRFGDHNPKAAAEISKIETPYSAAQAGSRSNSNADGAATQISENEQPIYVEKTLHVYGTNDLPPAKASSVVPAVEQAPASTQPVNEVPAEKISEEKSPVIEHKDNESRTTTAVDNQIPNPEAKPETARATAEHLPVAEKTNAPATENPEADYQTKFSNFLETQGSNKKEFLGTYNKMLEAATDQLQNNLILRANAMDFLQNKINSFQLDGKNLSMIGNVLNAEKEFTLHKSDWLKTFSDTMLGKNDEDWNLVLSRDVNTEVAPILTKGGHAARVYDPEEGKDILIYDKDATFTSQDTKDGQVLVSLHRDGTTEKHSQNEVIRLAKQKPEDITDWLRLQK